MSLSIQQSVVEKFNFDGEDVRSIYIHGEGQCTVASDVYKVVGYSQRAGVQAIRRLVPRKYKMQLGDVEIDLQGVLKSECLHPDTVLLKEHGVYCFLLRCNKAVAEPFMDWVVETVLPREVRKLSQKLEEYHRRTTQLQQAVEDRDNRIQGIEYKSVGLQGEIQNARRTITDLIENRHVARCGEYDNILVGVQKNKPIEDDAKKSRHAFYMMRCQKRRKGLLMARLKKEYRYMSEKGICEDPNVVHRWCWFKEDVLREDNYYRNHFSLDTNTKREFEELFGIYMD